MNQKITYRNHFFTPVKLPDFSIFESQDATVSPFGNFHQWIAKQFSRPENSKIDVASTFLHPADAEKLKSLVRKWMMKSLKLSAFEAGQELSWHNLSIGPAEFHTEVPNEFKQGFAYVNEDKLFSKNN